MGDVREAFDKSVEQATHLTDMDAGAVAAARSLADKIDAWDVIVDWAMEDAAESDSRPAVPQNDNVALPSFLKYCESLGLTPAGRARLSEKKQETTGGTLASLQQHARGARKAG